jgi:hypothetical protein
MTRDEIKKHEVNLRMTRDRVKALDISPAVQNALQTLTNATLDILRNQTPLDSKRSNEQPTPNTNYNPDNPSWADAVQAAQELKDNEYTLSGQSHRAQIILNYLHKRQ